MITNEIIEGFLNCPYKSFLKNKLECGKKSKYEIFFSGLRKKYKDDWLNYIAKKYTLIKNLEINKLAELNIKNNSYLIDSFIKSKELNIHFNFIFLSPNFEKKQVDSLIPEYISPNEIITSIDKNLFTILTFLLKENTNLKIKHLRIIYGNNYKSKRINYDNYSIKVSETYEIIKTYLSNQNPSRFYQISHCKICEFRERCKSKLTDLDDLSLLGHISPKVVENWNKKGIFSINQLSYTFKPRKNKKQHLQNNKRYLWELKALALREQKTYIREIFNFPNSEIEIFFDFEGLPSDGYIYLIGLIVVNGRSIIKKSFWADCSSKEESIFIDFIDYVSNFSSFTIYHFGNYEIKFLKKLNSKLDDIYKKKLEKIINNSFNLLTLFFSHYYPPTYSNELKEIANFIGFEWSSKELTGIYSIVLRKKWEETQHSLFMNELIVYNLEDCLALKCIKEWIERLNFSIENQENSEIINVEDLQYKSTYKFGKNNFIIPIYDSINNYAYFNYQREKVYLKNNNKIKKIVSRPVKQKKIHVNKTIEFSVPENCPTCGNKKLYKHANYHKIITDLVFSGSCIKKVNIKCVSPRMRCCNCNKVFISEEYKNYNSTENSNLLKWVINQHISYGISFRKINEILYDSFNLDISTSHLHTYKKRFKHLYSDAYEEIKHFILDGHLLHIDETKISVQGKSGYIWVLSNMEAVFFIFKQNRKCAFLKELLNEFTGVLVSDFYTGFDSLKCKQQKCLIHLIRDLNDDLFKNQFNNEFKKLVQLFGELLNSILITINKFGLKKRYLKKHKHSVAHFFKIIKNINSSDEVVKKYKKRFEKYTDKLFTFLDFDSIPWNNNNAEHAFKHLALYRRNVDGLFTENGLNEYLFILSLHQTCKYQGVSFFKYLLSGERSIFDYSNKLYRLKE